MTARPRARTSIAKSLLIQLCALEFLEVILFRRGGLTIFGGIVAPVFAVVLPFIALAEWSRTPSAPEMLVAGLIAFALLASGFVARLYFANRVLAHLAFALFSLFSILLLAAQLT